MEKKTKYIIEEEVALVIKKLTGKISDVDMTGNFGLTEREKELIHKFYDLVEEIDEEE